MEKREIASFMGQFGSAARDAFNNIKESMSDKEIESYNNIIENRHNVAHREGVQMAFHELTESLPAVEKLLKAIAISLSVKLQNSS